MKKAAKAPDATAHASVFRSMGNWKNKYSQKEGDGQDNKSGSSNDAVNTLVPEKEITDAVPVDQPTENKVKAPENNANNSGFHVATPTANEATKETTGEEENDNDNEESTSAVQSETLSNDVPPSGADEPVTKVDSPKNFANNYFAGVSGYSWEQLKVYLGSDGSEKQNLKLRQLLNIFILHNQQLSPTELWNNITTDPTKLKGYQSFKVYYGEADNNVSAKATISFQEISDIDSGIETLKDQIVYTPRHFIFLTENNKERSAKASQEATDFLQNTAASIQEVVNGVNENKKLLEHDLRELTSGLNQKMASDAESKNRFTNELTVRIQGNAQIAKDDIIKDYKQSLAEIDKNTSFQKGQLRTTTQRTADKLYQLRGDQQGELNDKFNAFSTEVTTLATSQSQEAINQGNKRANTMGASNFGKVKKEAVTKVAKDVSSEVQELSAKTIKTALDKEDQATTPYQNSLQNLYNELALQERELNDQNKEYKESARILMEAHITKVDELAITAIGSLTNMLEVYFDKLSNFSTLETEVINAFYSGSVSKLDAASKDMISQSRERLAAFQSSEDGLKKPGKRRRIKNQERVTQEISPWLAQASHESGEVSNASQAELTIIRQNITSTFDQVSSAGTDNLLTFTEGALVNISGIRQKATPVIMEVSRQHAGEAANLAAGAKKELESEVTNLKQVYQDQLVAVENKLQDKLNMFAANTQELIMGLEDRMNQAEAKVTIEDADKDEDHGLLYDGFQYILDNSPINFMIKDFLERWRKIPKTERAAAMKKSMQYARAILVKMRNAPSSWLEDLINKVMPIFKWMNIFMREFQVGFLEHLILLPDTELVEAIENLLYNQTRLDFYIGIGIGIGEGLVGWVMDIINTVKDVGSFIIDLFDIPAHIEKIKKIGSKVADAIEYLNTEEGKQKLLAILKKFKPADMLDAIEGIIMGMANKMGATVADELVKFMKLGPKAMGISIGRLIGYILAEILVAVFSSGAVTAIKAGLKSFQFVIKVLRPLFSSIGKITRKLASEAVNVFADAMRFVKDLIKMFKASGKDTTFLDKLHDFIEGMKGFMKSKVDDALTGKKEFIEIDDVSGKGTKLDEVSKKKGSKAKELENKVDEPTKNKLREDSKKDPELDKKNKDYDSKLVALATAKIITEGADKVDLSIMSLMEALAFLKKMDGVTGFGAKPKGPVGRYKIVMYGCEPTVDIDYSTLSHNQGKYNYGKFKGKFIDYVDEIRKDLGIPDDWTVKPEKFGDGIRFSDPLNPENSHIRVSPGVNAADHAPSRVPNVKWYKNGSPMDEFGNKISQATGKGQNRTPQGHISYQRFKYK